MNSLSIGELADITAGRLNLGTMPPLGGAWEPVRRIVADVEQVSGGDVFWAMRDEASEAARPHPPTPEAAFARGAVGVVADGRHVEPWAGAFSIRVADTRDALERLAAWSRDQFTGELIGVGGEHAGLVARAIDRILRGRKVGSIGAFGNTGACAWLWELAQLDAGLDYALLPMDAGNFFEDSANSVLCRPNIAVINCTRNTRQSCLELSPRQLSVIETLGRTGWAVIHGDGEVRRQARRLTPQVLVVGEGDECDLTARQVSSDGNRLNFSVDGEAISLLGWQTKYLSAALIALAVGRLMNVAWKDAVRRLAHEPLAEASQDAGRIRAA